jgi:hypothetical protein
MYPEHPHPKQEQAQLIMRRLDDMNDKIDKMLPVLGRSEQRATSAKCKRSVDQVESQA